LLEGHPSEQLIFSTMPTEKRYCHCCAQVLHGRLDKKFCDEGCRNNFNNQQNSVQNKEIRIINRVLKRNRAILLAFLALEKKQTKVDRECLLLEGFNFRYMTHQGVDLDGQLYQICYDVGLISEQHTDYLIVLAKDVVH
jgi:hypothetical protein